MSAADRTVLLATRNAGKVREMRPMLAPLGWALVGVDELEAERGERAPEIAETGETFFANALLKAEGYGAWSGLPVISEDSGLEVDALDGRPGVYSSRFAGRDGDDAANNDKLLDELRDVPPADRTARYRTVTIFLEAPEAEPIVAEGTWEGRIHVRLAGEGGFGYDPLFWVPEHGCTSAQLSPAEKNRLSHRGKAVRALIERLRQTA